MLRSLKILGSHWWRIDKVDEVGLVTEIMSTIETIFNLVVAVLVALVTNWSLLTLRLVQEDAAQPDFAEHHRLPLTVTEAEDVVWLGVVMGAVPVVPADIANVCRQFEETAPS